MIPRKAKVAKKPHPTAVAPKAHPKVKAAPKKMAAKKAPSRRWVTIDTKVTQDKEGWFRIDAKMVEAGG